APRNLSTRYGPSRPISPGCSGGARRWPYSCGTEAAPDGATKVGGISEGVAPCCGASVDSSEAWTAGGSSCVDGSAVITVGGTSRLGGGCRRALERGAFHRRIRRLDVRAFRPGRRLLRPRRRSPTPTAGAAPPRRLAGRGRGGLVLQVRAEPAHDVGAAALV